MAVIKLNKEEMESIISQLKNIEQKVDSLIGENSGYVTGDLFEISLAESSDQINDMLKNLSDSATNIKTIIVSTKQYLNFIIEGFQEEDARIAKEFSTKE